jgi:hypothetical protein
MGLKKEAAVGLFAAARCAWFFGAGRVLIVDEYDKERVPALSEAGFGKQRLCAEAVDRQKRGQ